MAIPLVDPLVTIHPHLTRQPVPLARDPAGHHTQGTWVGRHRKGVVVHHHLLRQHLVICTADQPGLRVHKVMDHDHPTPEVRVAPLQQQLVPQTLGSPMVDNLPTRINIRYAFFISFLLILFETS